MKTTLKIIVLIMISFTCLLAQNVDRLNKKHHFLMELKSTSPQNQSDNVILTSGAFNYSNSKTVINKNKASDEYLLAGQVGYAWQDTTWGNVWKDTYTYDGNNNMTEILDQVWDGSFWVNQWRRTNTYNENNNMVQSVWQDWDSTEWVNTWKDIYTYSDGNLRYEALWYLWNGTEWELDGRVTFEYDNEGNVIEELGESWDGSQYVNDWKDTYTYDANNNMVESLWQIWNVSDWMDFWRDTYTYDANNNRIEHLFEMWFGTAWNTNSKWTWTYDGNNNMVGALFQGWSGTDWIDVWKYIYTYDGNNNMVEELGFEWDGSGWANLEKIISTYIPVTGIEQFTDGVYDYKLSNNYPNPFNPSTIIKYSIPEQAFVQLRVFDTIGREIITLVDRVQSAGSYEMQFRNDGLSSPSSDGGRIASGVYFYQLRVYPAESGAGDFVQTKKMILMK
ncbi:T9SS type A sorting domain-containing protein [Bacteroidota bacterium]